MERESGEGGKSLGGGKRGFFFSFLFLFLDCLTAVSY